MRQFSFLSGKWLLLPSVNTAVESGNPKVSGLSKCMDGCLDVAGIKARFGEENDKVSVCKLILRHLM